MIAESTPFGGMQVTPPSDLNITLQESDGDVWDLWFQPTLDLIEKYDISMWSYINCDWDSQKMWNGVGFGDTRISSNAKVMQKWQEKVLGRHSRFISELSCSCNHVPSASSMLHPKAFLSSGHSLVTSSFVMPVLVWVLAGIAILSIVYLVMAAIMHLCCQLRVDKTRSESLSTANVRYGAIPKEENQSSMSLNL